jgi:beta-N-acetylhexosaminidase
MAAPINFLSVILSGLLMITACNRPKHDPLSLAPFYKTDAERVEAALRQMSTEQKISQMIVVKTQEEALLQVVAEDARRGMIGGVIPENLSLGHWQDYVQSLRSNSRYPLFVGATESGLFNTLFSDAVPFPDEYTLRATASPALLEQLAAIRLRQAQWLGINLCPGPSLYPQTLWNPDTKMPFEDFSLPDYETRRWNQAGIIQLGNRIFHHQVPAADSNALQPKPYRQLLNDGIPGFWIDSTLLSSDTEATNHLRRYLEESLAADALLVGEGPIEPLVRAGADIIIWNGHPEEARKTLLDLVNQRIITLADLDQRTRRILSARFWTSENTGKAAHDSLRLELFQNDQLAYYARRLWEQSPILLADAPGLIPLPADKPYRIISLAADTDTTFLSAFSQFVPPDTLVHRLSTFDTGKINIIYWDSHAKTLDSSRIGIMNTLAPAVIIHTGPLKNLSGIDPGLTVVQLPSLHDRAVWGAVQLITGAQGASARLPDGLEAKFLPLSGIKTAPTRLKHTSPEEEGICSEKLLRIDALAQEAIEEKIFPGCQVLVAKNGHIIYAKAFGHLSYKDEVAVTNQTLYDIASITKVVATTLVAMKMIENQQLQLDLTLSDYIPEAKGDMGKITLRQLLSHTSGLQPYLPTTIYKQAPLWGSQTCNAFFCNKPAPGYTIPVAANLYFRDSQYRELIKSLYQLPVNRRKKVVYSDNNMVLLQQVLERKSRMPLDSLASAWFYQPLGLRRMSWQAWKKFPLREIAPTKKDTQFRNQTIHGYVDDSGAALLGGVAGHAGLFTNAADLAVIFQLLLNDGRYGDRTYLTPNTIRQFTAYDSRTRRGLGFDKPRAVASPTFSAQLPQEAFGHTGFTGTCVWADPKEKLIYIFLSNRVHPDANNNRIYKNNIRKRIHEVIYDALNTCPPKLPDA